jgi:hypothetical protein
LASGCIGHASGPVLRGSHALLGKPHFLQSSNMLLSSSDSLTRLRGGADTEPESKAYTGFEHSIKFTKAADTILGEDDPNRLRATMSCGHAVDPEALTAYTRSALHLV